MRLVAFESRCHSLATLKLTQTPLERLQEGEKRSSESNGAAKLKDRRSGF